MAGLLSRDLQSQIQGSKQHKSSVSSENCYIVTKSATAYNLGFVRYGTTHHTTVPAIEQSEPVQPAVQLHTPREHEPCPLQPAAHALNSQCCPEKPACRR